MTQETIYGFLAVMFLMLIGALIYAAGNYSARKKKGLSVPNLRGVPPLPQSFKYPRPIIEQQYGRDLLNISTEIYLKLNEQSGGSTRVEHAVEQAELLIAKVGEKCFKIDLENRENSKKATDKMVKQGLANMGKNANNN